MPAAVTMRYAENRNRAKRVTGMEMNTKTRILMLRLTERINRHPAYCRQLGLVIERQRREYSYSDIREPNTGAAKRRGRNDL